MGRRSRTDMEDTMSTHLEFHPDCAECLVAHEMVLERIDARYRLINDLLAVTFTLARVAARLVKEVDAPRDQIELRASGRLSIRG